MQKFDHISEDIQQLIVDYITKSITPSDLGKLNVWLKSDLKNAELLNEFKTAWLISAKRENPEPSSISLLWNTIEKEISRTEEPRAVERSLRTFKFIRIAATWIVLIALGYLLNALVNNNFTHDLKLVEYTVPKGSKSNIKLPDGTIVWLNAGSTLKYDNSFDQKDRKVYLTGEGYFRVTTNKNKPFQVHTSDLVVRAFGTRFNVKAYPDEKIITTTLEEGMVDIVVIDKKQKNSEKPLVLKPNEKVVYFIEGRPEKPREEIIEPKHNVQLISKNIKIEENINTNLYTSWKNNEWIIESQTLKCLTPMLERKYNMTFCFKDDELKKYKFTGIIQNETVEQILKLLSYTAPIKYVIEKDTVYLSVDQKLQPQFKKITTTRQ